MQTLFSDEDIIVINKPPKVLSVPGKTMKHGESATTRLEKLFGEIHVVHRLDCETSGIMVFARNKEALRELHRQFRERETEKEYVAIVGGTLESPSGEVDLPLICDWPNRPKQKIDFETGKPSLTKYQIISRLEDRTRVKLFPITGRSHQLRVHMMSLGHPILGDKLYATDEIKAMSPRLCLHAEKLSFKHPISAEKLTFKIDPDF